MVDVGGKPATLRRAVAEGALLADTTVIAALRSGATPKGNVLETARVAGIMAAKRCADLVPLCHSLPLDHVALDFDVKSHRIEIRAEARTRAATGVEMEVLTAVAVAALTLYDMLKALSKSMVISEVRLVAKSGGRSGTFRAARTGGSGTGKK